MLCGVYLYGGLQTLLDQCVKVAPNLSNPKIINLLEHHRPMLGLLLFFFCINDFRNVYKLLSPILFAEDTTISITDVYYADLITHTISKFPKIICPLVTSRYSVNFFKTLLLLFINCGNRANMSVNVYFRGEEVNFEFKVIFLIFMKKVF